MSQKEVIITRQADRQPLKALGEQISVLADGERTGSLEVFFQEGLEGAGPPPHAHPWDEAFFVVEGVLTLTLVDQQQVHALKQGDFIHIPAGTFHAFQLGPETRFISMTSHPGAAELFRDADREVGGQQGDEVDFGKVVEVLARHDVDLHPAVLAGVQP